MTRLRRIGLGGGLAVALLAALYCARGNLLPWAARWLDVGQPPQRADYVLALGGDVNVRPFVAAALVRAGFARQVLISQVIEANESLFPPDQELCRRTYQAAGIPAERCLPLGHGCQSTYDEACALRAFLRSHPDARVLVVTNAYHTRRSRWIFRQILGPQAAALGWVSAPNEAFQAENWWRTCRGLQFVPAENLRFLYYVWRYSPATRWTLLAGLTLLLMVWLWRRLRKTVRRGSSPTAG